MTIESMRLLRRKRIAAVTAGALFAPYLLLAALLIPAGVDGPGHYDIGNALVHAIFFSYAALAAQLGPVVAIAMYSGYVYLALLRRRRLGLMLFAAHYVIAGAVVVPVYLHQWPNLRETTRLQMIVLADRPWTLLFTFGPFVLANVWYLARLLAPGRAETPAYVP
ncbi:hypothetical protein ASF77_06345 [Massilia sp. Leaf139]|nr:hypothetical protein ASF77_06345 [Massilia sp. Leaf139]